MRTVALGELCDITVGRTPARANPEFWGPGEPWLSIADMNQGNSIQTTKEQITASGAASGKQIPAGTVLLSFKLSIGKVAVASMPLFTNEAIAALPVRDPDRVETKYLLRALGALDLGASANRAAMGATLNKAALQTVQIPLPSLPEQRRIAAILDHADALRAKRRHSRTLLDTLAPILFGDCCTGAACPRVRLGDLMVEQQIGLDRGASSQAPDRAFEYVKMDAITREGKLDLSRLTRVDASAAEFAKYSVADGDLLLNTRNSRELVGKSAVYRGVPRLYNNNLMRIRLEPRALPDYVHQYLWTPEGKQQLEARKAGTTSVFAVYAKSLATLELPLPPLELQREFASRVAEINAQRAAARRSLDSLDELFASLQSRAFSGEL